MLAFAGLSHIALALTWQVGITCQFLEFLSAYIPLPTCSAGDLCENSAIVTSTKIKQQKQEKQNMPLLELTDIFPLI